MAESSRSCSYQKRIIEACVLLAPFQPQDYIALGSYSFQIFSSSFCLLYFFSSTSSSWAMRILQVSTQLFPKAAREWPARAALRVVSMPHWVSWLPPETSQLARVWYRERWQKKILLKCYWLLMILLGISSSSGSKRGAGFFGESTGHWHSQNLW